MTSSFLDGGVGWRGCCRVWLLEQSRGVPEAQRFVHVQAREVQLVGHDKPLGSEASGLQGISSNCTILERSWLRHRPVDETGEWRRDPGGWGVNQAASSRRAATDADERCDESRADSKNRAAVAARSGGLGPDMREERAAAAVFVNAVPHWWPTCWLGRPAGLLSPSCSPWCPTDRAVSCSPDTQDVWSPPTSSCGGTDGQTPARTQPRARATRCTRQLRWCLTDPSGGPARSVWQLCLEPPRAHYGLHLRHRAG